MAFTSGTATNYLHLLTLLNTYATGGGGSNVPTASQWTSMRNTTSTSTTGSLTYTVQEMILRGPGAGSDSIYAGALTVSNVTGDYYNWKIGCFTGFSTAQAFELQAGYSGETPHPVHFTLWDGSIPYWFIVNGRRIIVVAKISTVYVICYLGFILPYASPGQFPYPVMVGGNLSFGAESLPAVTSSRYRWSDTTISNSNFPFAGAVQGLSNLSPFSGRSATRARVASGTWRDFWAAQGNGFNPSDFGPSTNAHFDTGSGNFDTIPSLSHSGLIWPTYFGCTEMDPNIDGTFPLFPIVLVTGPATGDAADALGEVEGVYWVTGQGLSAEDVVTVSSVNHLVIPNVFRNGVEHFVAVALA